MAALRTHALKLRLSGEEFESVRARAGAEPMAVFIRRIVLEQPAPKRRPRRAMTPVHPQVAELVRVVALAANRLDPLPLAGLRSNPSALPATHADAVLRVLNVIAADLRRVLEMAR
jgi:hypothetical protein